VSQHKAAELGGLTTRRLRARRRRLARGLTDWEAVLRGSLVSQHRRCGKEGCRCSRGELHGPYTYVSLPSASGAARLRYLPEPLVEAVRGHLAATAVIEAGLAEISAINTELLARRELD
jgi:hypothetical protein